MCDLTSNKRRRFNEPMFQLGVEDAVNETTVLFKVEARWKACPVQLVNQWGSSGGRTLKTSETVSHTFHPPPSISHIPVFLYNEKLLLVVRLVSVYRGRRLITKIRVTW